jgi:glycosyltransferase involved in cell wall biosynthesis
MIVKNESKVIHRILNSVVNIIDTFCICDTGSTDDTVEMIEKYFQQKNIPGKVIVEPFQDFGYNRSFALKACEQMNAEYILLLDADMVFWKNPAISADDFKKSLTKDAYHIYQGSDTYYYKNTRIVRNRMGFKYWGVTHEYVDFPKDASQSRLNKDVVFIRDIGDGGSKQDKFLRDIRLLLKGLEEIPDNDRYTFYLANSYKDSGQYESAIEYYKKRAEIGGWIEEVWYSHYNIGKCWKALNEPEKAICAWMDAYQSWPNRIESLYEIIQHFRYLGKNRIAYMYFLMADRMRKDHTERDYLFMQRDVYDYKLDFELTIIAYYENLDKYNLNIVNMKVVSDPNVEKWIYDNVMSNYKFTADKAIEQGTDLWQKHYLLPILESIGTEVLQKNPDFVSSTPTFCVLPNKRWVFIVRIVNYKIKEDGGYENPGTIHTINAIVVLEKNIKTKKWTVIKEGVLKYNTAVDGYYIGLEDIRLSSLEDGTVIYNANRGIEAGNMVVEHGKINMDTLSTYDDVFLEKDGQCAIEKNWVLFPSTTRSKRMVYKWHPLTIGEVNGNEFRTVNTHPTLSFFKHIRGSCNGVEMNHIGETWFLCHVVSYEDRRYYYHIIIALDNTTSQVSRFTRFFTFEREKVEYALGFEKMANEFLIGYSTFDRTTKYMTVPLKWFESLFYDPKASVKMAVE